MKTVNIIMKAVLKNISLSYRIFIAKGNPIGEEIEVGFIRSTNKNFKINATLTVISQR